MGRGRPRSAPLTVAPIRRFFTAEAGTSPETLLDDAESAYLLRVLRLRPGVEVEVFDGAGKAYAARFAGRDPGGRCRLAVGARRAAPEPRIRLEVALAIPKGDGFTRIARRLAEMGITKLTPLVTARSEGPVTASRQARWRAAALAGTRQSGGSRIPRVEPPTPFAAFVASALPAARWISSPHSPAPPLRPDRAAAAGPKRLVAIGPEGGFTPDELDAADDAGFLRLSLGPRVLRTGTAAVVAAARLLGTTGPER